MFKRFMNLKFVQLVLAFLLALYMRFIRRTTRWSTDNNEALVPVQESGEGFVACAWHSRFMLTTAGWTKMRQLPHVLISRSRDGNLVAYTSKFLKLGVIRGSRKAKLTSTAKRGTGAMLEMITTIETGDCIFMTPDGPRGPRMRIGEGPVRLAKLTGAPLMAYGLSTSRHVMFNTWDKFMLPLPFGKGKIVWGGPLWVDKDADDKEIERLRAEFESILIDVTRRADMAVGNTPILPADRVPSHKKRART